MKLSIVLLALELGVLLVIPAQAERAPRPMPPPAGPGIVVSPY